MPFAIALNFNNESSKPVNLFLLICDKDLMLCIDWRYPKITAWVQDIMLPAIDRKAFPELDLILWDRADRYIPAVEAFHKYEERWRYVDQTCLGEVERLLIADLTKIYGQGLFLTT
jgi:hypothetical protein